MRRKSLSYTLLGGVVIGALAWIDPIFIPLVLLGPLVTGFVCGWRVVPLRYLAGAWAIGGISMLVSDQIANHEDKAFHAVLTLVMVGLACAAWAAGRFSARRRTRTAVV
ncbi:MAG: hypothetical protein QOD85_307 [Gaiellaceae bacterium]|jgi:hypothetical protein|nr:hypothetical protein [Gaiellaceae bacterium]MDX6412785.1 hypothetical protein [Gaiellaceae bacterium]